MAAIHGFSRYYLAGAYSMIGRGPNFLSWGDQWGSNPRLLEPQSNALPTELWSPCLTDFQLFVCCPSVMGPRIGSYPFRGYPMSRRSMYLTSTTLFLTFSGPVGACVRMVNRNHSHRRSATPADFTVADIA